MMLKKRFLSIVVTIIMLISSIPVNFTYVYAESSGNAGASGDGTDVVWSLSDDGKLVISGSGKMKDYSTIISAPWGTDITSVEIQQGVTSIGTFAFYNCTSLKAVSIADSVTTIGDYSFNKSAVVNVTIPKNVASVGQYAFMECESLEKVTFLGADTTIDRYAF